MKFHLDFQPPPLSTTIHYEESLFFIGSCFAENIAAQLNAHKFKVVLNPHGILYNPMSIATAIRRYMKNEPYNQQDLFYANNSFHSWDHHSRFSHPDALQCLTEINTQIHHAQQMLKNAGWLFITLGSSYVYNHQGRRVANCHKQPSAEFTKELLTVEEMLKAYRDLIADLQQWNPSLKIIFTVSPVRYVRDGVVENNRSKARLIELIHSVKDDKKVMYFPAYELMLDDLRDYRFYKPDLLHPNEQAIAYIFEKFTQAAFDQNTLQLFEKIKDIVKAKSHRVLQDHSAQHQKFQSTYFNRCRELQEHYPFLTLQEELLHFSVSST
jgi:hypothetical protein